MMTSESDDQTVKEKIEDKLKRSAGKHQTASARHAYSDRRDLVCWGKGLFSVTSITASQSEAATFGSPSRRNSPRFDQHGMMQVDWS